MGNSITDASPTTPRAKTLESPAPWCCTILTSNISRSVSASCHKLVKMPPFHDAPIVSTPVDLWPHAVGVVYRAEVAIGA